MFWELDAVRSRLPLSPISSSFSPPLPSFSPVFHIPPPLTLFPDHFPRQDLRPSDALAAHALVPIVTSQMGGLDRSGTNCLDYKGSKWDNLRKGTI